MFDEACVGASSAVGCYSVLFVDVDLFCRGRVESVPFVVALFVPCTEGVSV